MNAVPTEEEQGNPSVLPLYLGLFLTLLTFFIMFNGLALQASAGTRARAGSNPEVRLSSEHPAVAAEDGDPDKTALAAVAAALRRIGATPIAPGSEDSIASLKVTSLDVTLAAAALFANDTSTLQPMAIVAIDRTATALATPRGEQRLVLQVTIGRGHDGPIAAAAALQRAAGLAAALIERGAPPGTFVTGIARAPAGEVHLQFRLLGTGDAFASAF